MAEDTEYLKLPLLQRCSHKLWKARVHGYTEAAQLFQEEDEKSAVFGQYLGLISKFVSDSHAAAQEKGLEATLYFVENASVAGKTVKDVMSAIIAKSIAATKKNAQDLSLKIILMYIEIEKQEAVVDELLKGLEHKNPKIVAACLSTLTKCLNEFGSQVVAIKSLIKPIQNLIEDRDKSVRDETKTLLIEIFRWIGESIKPLLTKLKPVQLTELENEFTKIRGTKAVPTRFLRSQQVIEEKTPAALDEPDDGNAALIEEEIIDPLTLIDPINILSKIPNDFYEKLEAKKWQDRKETLENLDKILDYPKFEKNDYGDLVRALLKIINKDSNVVVVGVAIKCLVRLALGLKKNFHPYASATLAPLLAKFKEKKVNVVIPLREAVDAIFSSTSLESIMDDVVVSLDSKNPSIKAETAGFIGRCFAQSTPTELNKKLLKPYVTALLKTLNEPDPNVRDSSAEALGTAMKVVSEKIILPFLGDIDPIKLTKIKECCEKAVVKIVVVKRKAEPLKQSKPIKTVKQQIQNKTKVIEEIVFEEEIIENKKTNERIDLSNKLTDELIAELSDKNWKVRHDALLNLQSMLNNTKIKPTLGELPGILVQRFVDSNSKIIATTLEVCGNLAVALGVGSKNYVSTFARGIFNALGDSKQPVRSAALTCLKTWTSEAGAKEFFYGEIIPDILKTSSNVLKNEVWTWLGELLPTVKTLPKDELCLLIPCLFSALEDRNADVRKAGNNAVFGVMMHVGYQNMLKEAEKLKPASKPGIIQILDKIRPDVPELEIQSKPINETKGKMAPPKAVPTKKVRNSICPSTVKPKPKKEEEIDCTPLLLVNKLKNQRVLDEQKLKILKWNFTTPRQEFVDLLKDQMSSAGFNKTLITNMFHSDFKFHIKAIELLIDDLYNQDALVSNLDLILKWMTLRFFDTNPSVLLKGLEYLQSAFTILIDKEYAMFDFEANSFVPYLIMKIGDQKDTVRDRVRTILRQFSLMIPPGKLFLHVMDGLKSKNSRLRSESLDELGYLIEQFSTSVCLPSSAVALKEISKQIADRNNAVRSAALNTIVKAYFVDGDKIYKQIGKLSDKDMSYLEERIKRTSQNRTKMIHDITSSLSNETFKLKKSEPEMEKIDEAIIEIDNEPIIEKEPTPKSSPIIETQPSPKQSFPNPYAPYWDIKNPEIDISKYDIDIDDSFLYEPIYIPENIYGKMKYNAPPNPMVEELFKDVSNDNIKIAIDGLKKLNGVLGSELGANLNDYGKGVLDVLIGQLEKANAHSLANHGPLLGQLYKSIFKNIDTIFKTNSLIAKSGDKSQIKSVINLLLIALIEEKTKLFNGNDLNKWIMIFIANIIENSDTTNVTHALIDSLRDLIVNPASNQKLNNLYVKCILKIVIIIKNSNNLDEILNLNDVLLSCHLFMEDNPKSDWSDSSNFILFKAFNTLIVNLVLKKGTKILSNLKNIENPKSSQFVTYLKELVKQLPNSKKSVVKLDKNTLNKLDDIFKNLTDKNNVNDNLVELYEFKKNNPDVSLSSLLSETSHSFKEFIFHGLKAIENERGAVDEISHSVENSFVNNSKSQEVPADFAEQPLYFFNKLVMLQQRLGYPISVLSDFQIEKTIS